MDGDTHSIDEITTAMQYVSSSCKVLDTLVFADAERMASKKWQKMLTASGVMFHPVTREGTDKPCDSAIIAALESFTASSAPRVALLTSDRDFVPIVSRAIGRGKQLLVVAPKARSHVAELYRQAGAEVHVLKANREQVSRVQAILLPGGEGQVKTCNPIPRLSCQEELEIVKQELVKLGYCTKDQRNDFLVNPMAKFWYENDCGPLVLFPQGLAVQILHQTLLNNAARDWAACERELSLIMPCAKQGTSTASQIRDFGSNFAYCLYRGGGPSVFQDSPELPVRVLRKLGFLDEELNQDEREAYLVFANCSFNKHNLRLLGALPSMSDSINDVQDKFREAFLSNNSSAIWQLPPGDGLVRRLLVQERLLSHRRAASLEVFEAMRKYVKLRGLREMGSYNGLMWRIQHEHSKTHPDFRGLVDFHG